MKALIKTGILIEFILGFCGIFIFWIWGIFSSPLSILAILAGRFDKMLVLLLVILGGIGLYGICQLTIKLVSPKFRCSEARRLKGFLITGLGALCLLSYWIMIIGAEYLIIIMIFFPTLVTLHFCYLGRAYLWNNS